MAREIGETIAEYESDFDTIIIELVINWFNEAYYMVGSVLDDTAYTFEFSRADEASQAKAYKDAVAYYNSLVPAEARI